MKRVLIGICIVLLFLTLGFMLGPRPAAPVFSNPPEEEAPAGLEVVEQYVADNEARVPGIKPGNASRIVWVDSIPQRTEYVLLYLHGFSASPEEGRVLAEDFARRYHCNLYLPRLQAHGVDVAEPLLDFTAEGFYASALEGLSVARQLGQKVILMATSTGGTVALKMAAEASGVYALILYSPNIKIFDGSSSMLTFPWGLQMARMVMGSDYREFEADAYTRQYWTPRYRLEAVQQLQLLVEYTMKPETFRAVTQPLFLGYYYRDEAHQDNTVSIPAMLEMFDQLGTPADQKRKVAFPDANEHVIANPELSGAFEAVEAQTFRFADEVLGM